MNQSDAATWRPQPQRTENAHVTAIARSLGLSSYDELHAFSLSSPAAYWDRILDYVQIQWMRRPVGYAAFPRGPEFPLWFPGGELNWVETVLAWAERPETRDTPAVVAEQEDGGCAKVTFEGLAAAVRRFAAGLRREGILPGDRIGLLCENGLEATVAALAIPYIGAITVPLFSGFGAEAIQSRLSGCQARGLIASTGFHRRSKRVDLTGVVRDALVDLPGVNLVIWKQSAGLEAPAGAISWSSVAACSDPDEGARPMSANDPFMVIYTSGTTGKPKGAVHTHGGFPLKIAHDSAVHFDVGPGDVFCWPADMGWIAGTLVMASALMRGATLVCYDGAPDFPDWSRMSRLVAAHGVTHYGSAPTLIRGLAAHVPLSLAGDLTSLELLITAGEVIDPEHFGWFGRTFGAGRSPVINYTGGTEVSGALLSSVVVREIAPGAFNTVSPAVEVDVVDDLGRSLVGTVGELAIRAPFVGMTQSFWKDDERYLDTYWRTVPGLWIHGDLAIRHASGAFTMMGRSDDTIKLAGKRVGPAEVEEVALEIPEVNEAAAVGVQDAMKGEKLIVFVVPAACDAGQRSQIGAAVSAALDNRLGRPFRPSHVFLVSQLPKTRSSKVMRRLIKQICNGQPLGDLTALDNPSALDEVRSAASALEGAPNP